MDRPTGVTRKTVDYLRQQGLVWKMWLDAFHDSRNLRRLRKAEGGWIASVGGRNVSPAFPDPIPAYVYAETNGWAPEENAL